MNKIIYGVFAQKNRKKPSARQGYVAQRRSYETGLQQRMNKRKQQLMRRINESTT